MIYMPYKCILQIPEYPEWTYSRGDFEAYSTCMWGLWCIGTLIDKLLIWIKR
jgi:hypothetical protein